MTESKKQDYVLWVAATIIIIFVAGLLTNGFGLLNPQTPNVKLEIKDSPVLGDKNAPVTIYEFSDFSCPYCAAADGHNPSLVAALQKKYPGWEPIIPKIINEYVKTGKAKLVFKYSPGHGTAKYAHEVAWCLNDQNLFWEFHDKAFSNQSILSDTQAVKQMASSLGANMPQLQQCIDSNKYEYMFEQDESMGISAKIEGTPTFIVNNKIVANGAAATITDFEKLI